MTSTATADPTATAIAADTAAATATATVSQWFNNLVLSAVVTGLDFHQNLL